MISKPLCVRYIFSRREFLFIIPLWFSVGSGSIQRANTEIQDCHLEFTILNAGFEVTGVIDSVEAEINFDPDNLKKSTIVAKAVSSTINTGIAIRDKHLMKKDYLDARDYPTLIARSKGFSKSESGFLGEFDLTIKGITKEVMISFVQIEQRNGTRYIGNFKINRLDFHIGETSSILDESVRIQIDMLVKR
jgi:polyisoprenoid-binding protein YceI